MTRNARATICALGVPVAMLLAIPLLVATPQAPDSPRTVEITLSRFAFSPQRIEIALGERVRLHLASADGTHGFRVKKLGLNVNVPADGKTVTVELTPNEAGRFAIDCSEYCGVGHSRMKAWLIVTPGR